MIEKILQTILVLDAPFLLLSLVFLIEGYHFEKPKLTYFSIVLFLLTLICLVLTNIWGIK